MAGGCSCSLDALPGGIRKSQSVGASLSSAAAVAAAHAATPPLPGPSTVKPAASTLTSTAVSAGGGRPAGATATTAAAAVVPPSTPVQAGSASGGGGGGGSRVVSPVGGAALPIPVFEPGVEGWRSLHRALDMVEEVSCPTTRLCWKIELLRPVKHTLGIPRPTHPRCHRALRVF